MSIGMFNVGNSGLFNELPIKVNEPYHSFLVVGDSIFAGYNNTTGPGQAPSPGTAYSSDGTKLTEITSDANWPSVAAGQGSPWGKFAYDYNINTGKKVVMVTKGFSGSDFVYENDANHWGSGGNLYVPARNTAIRTLNLTGEASLKGIFVCLGTNDIVGTGSTDAQLEAGINTFFSTLVTDFPGVPILVIQPGANLATTVAHYTRFNKISWAIRLASQTYADVQIVDQLYPYVSAGLISADNVHPNVSGVNMIGSKYAKWFTLTAWTNKYVRGLINCFFDDLTTPRKSLLDTFLKAEIANGNLFNDTQYFHFLNAYSYRNSCVDWTLLGGFIASAGTFTSNDGIKTNGSSNYIVALGNPYIYTKTGLGINDFFFGADIIQNYSAGVTGRVFSWGYTGANICLTQSGSVVSYQVADATGTSLSETEALAQFYILKRESSTAKKADRDFSNISSVSVSSIAFAGSLNHNTTFGANNTSGTISQYLSIKFKALIMGRATTFDFSGFATNYANLESGW